MCSSLNTEKEESNGNLGLGLWSGLKRYLITIKYNDLHDDYSWIPSRGIGNGSDINLKKYCIVLFHSFKSYF